MRSISKINVQESIERKRLIFEEDFFEKLETYFSYFLLLVFLSQAYTLFFLIEYTNANEKFYALFFGCFLVVGFYIIIKKLLEKRLKTIQSKFDQEQNRDKILEYASLKGLKIYRRSNECIILYEANDSFGHHTSSVFLLDGRSVYYCMLKDGFRFNMPVIISSYFLKKDLKKLLC